MKRNAYLALGLLNISCALNAQTPQLRQLWANTYGTPGAGEYSPNKVVKDSAENIIMAGASWRGNNGDAIIKKYDGITGTPLWEAGYNGPSNSYDYLEAVAVDGNDNVIVTGRSFGSSTYDMFTVKYAAADGRLVWVVRYDGPANGEDGGQALATDANGNVIVAGYSSNDYYTAKYAGSNGTLIWERRYDSPSGGNDGVTAVAVDGSGNVIVTGYSVADIYTVKYAAADGAQLWAVRYNGSGNDDDKANAIALDGSGNVIITGYAPDVGSNFNYYTAKYAAADGDLLWERSYDGPSSRTDLAEALAVDTSGNVVVVGASLDAGGNGMDVYTIKYAATDGATVWGQRYDGPVGGYDWGTDVALDSAGNAIITGYSTDNGQYNYYTAKYAAADGAKVWDQRYNGPGSPEDYATSVVVDTVGNAVVSGSISTLSGYDFYTIKYAGADGAEIWSQRYDGPGGADEAHAVAMDDDGNVAVTGYSFGSNRLDILTIKYAASGTRLWEQRYDGTGHNDDVGQQVAMDNSGNVIVTGYTINAAGSSDYITAKYAAADGTLLWQQSYDSPANRDDYAYALALDGAGNVLVTGSSSLGVGANFTTAKYAAVDGALLWEVRYAGPGGYDYGQAIAVDSLNNVIVTGGSNGNGTQTDYYTAKYAAGDGALIWERRYNGPGGSADAAYDITVDSDDNPIVTGQAYGVSSDRDYYTAKYAAADGAILWEKIYSGSNSGYEIGTAVDVDSNGDVVVTGTSALSSWGAMDYYTAKYAGADGNLIWEKRYNGPGNQDDRAHSVGFDEDGHVVVTGRSFGAGGNLDYYTVRYAKTNGVTLGEARYNSPYNSTDQPSDGKRSMALGPEGRIAVTGNAMYGAEGDKDYATLLYESLPAPEIRLHSNGEIINNGDMTPSVTDYTDFEAVPLLGGQRQRDFFIANQGNAMLNLTGSPHVRISGAGALDFKVATVPETQVSQGGSTFFTIVFDPVLPGLRRANVSIGSDDLAGNPFTFAISGYGGLSTLLSQTIFFAPPPTVYLAEGPVALFAKASSGLPVSLSVLSGPGSVSVSGDLLTLTGPGTVKVMATQPGGGNYKAATSVIKSIVVKANPTTLTLINLNQRYDGTQKEVAVLGATNAVNITYKVNGAYRTDPPHLAGSYTVKAVEVGGPTKTSTLVVAKALLYVTPVDKRKFAGQPNPTLTSILTGLIHGDDPLFFTKSPVLTTLATTASPGGLYAIKSSGGLAANYTFIHRQGTLVVETFAGAYEALLVDSMAIPTGKLNITVPATSKTFTGKLYTATETAALPLKGTITTDTQSEVATGAVTVTKNGIAYVTNFTLPLYGNFLASVTRGGTALSSTDDGRELNTKAVAYAGAHTMVMEPVSAVVAGAGWAKAAVSTKGVMTLSGKLGDGTPFTAALTPDGDTNPGYRLFVQPYLPVRAQSYMTGAFELEPHPVLVNRKYVPTASLTWRKSFLTTDPSYRADFGPVTTMMTLDPWIKPSKTATLTNLLRLTGNTFGVQHTNTRSTSNGELPDVLRLNPLNTVSVQTPSANLRKWKTTLSTTYGTFTGSFELLDAGKRRVVGFSGVLRQPPTGDDIIGDGHYLLPPTSGMEKTTGEVLFQR